MAIGQLVGRHMPNDNHELVGDDGDGIPGAVSTLRIPPPRPTRYILVTPRGADSASALVSGAKNANFGYNQIVADCKPGEPVTPPLGSTSTNHRLSRKTGTET
jgi:hypothetical protein